MRFIYLLLTILSFVVSATQEQKKTIPAMKQLPLEQELAAKVSVQKQTQRIKKVSDKKAKQKQKGKHVVSKTERNPAQNSLFFQQVQQEVKMEFDKLTELCKRRTLKEKLVLMNNVFKRLRNIIQNNSEDPRLSDEDAIRLKRISNNIPPNSIYYTTTPIPLEEIEERDLLDEFRVRYGVYHNLEENATLAQFPDEWAKTIHTSLFCLTSPN